MRIDKLCAEFLENLDNNFLYEKIIHECKRFGDFLKVNYFVPPTIRRMVYRPYEGTGIISINKTTQEFCTRGKRLDSVITKTRVKDVRSLHLAILYDKSRIAQKYHAIAKIATISLLEGIGKSADDVNIILFNSKIYGPYNKIQCTYKKLLLSNGNGPSGNSRFDLALGKLLQMEWYKREGSRHLIIIGGSLPLSDKNILLDDIEVQETTILYITRLFEKGVKILYIPIFTEEEDFVDEMIGAYSARSFAKKIANIGVAVSEINSFSDLQKLRNGIREMLISRITHIRSYTSSEIEEVSATSSIKEDLRHRKDIFLDSP